MTSLIKEDILLNLALKFYFGDYGGVSERVEYAFPPMDRGAIESKRLAPSITSRRDLDKNKLIISQLKDDQLQPAGLDFTVGTKIYSSDVLLRVNSLSDLEKLRKFDLREGDEFILESDDLGRRVYYIVSKEKIKLPENLEMVVDAKSTTGRLGCMCQNVSNNNLIRREQGSIIAAVRPYSFPIKITAGKSRLLQAIIRYKQSAFMNHEEIKKSKEIQFSVNGEKLDLGKVITAEGLRLSFATDKVYVAKELAHIPGPINIDKRGYYNAEDYFELVSAKNEVIMQPRKLYLFGTQEVIGLGGVCGRLTREHAELLSGLWSHFAGFFWPGYNGEITLECWSDTKRLIRKGEVAGIVAFDELSRKKGFKSYEGSYQGQKAPRLPKVFKTD